MSDGFGEALPESRRLTGHDLTMRICELTVKNYRGWREPVSWRPVGHALIVGPNNTGKTTLLTAADIVLNPYRDRYRVRLEVSDFPDCDTSEPVEITVILDGPAGRFGSRLLQHCAGERCNTSGEQIRADSYSKLPGRS